MRGPALIQFLEHRPGVAGATAPRDADVRVAQTVARQVLSDPRDNGDLGPVTIELAREVEREHERRVDIGRRELLLGAGLPGVGAERVTGEGGREHEAEHRAHERDRGEAAITAGCGPGERNVKGDSSGEFGTRFSDRLVMMSSCAFGAFSRRHRACGKDDAPGATWTTAGCVAPRSVDSASVLLQRLLVNERMADLVRDESHQPAGGDQRIAGGVGDDPYRLPGGD